MTLATYWLSPLPSTEDISSLGTAYRPKAVTSVVHILLAADNPISHEQPQLIQPLMQIHTCLLDFSMLQPYFIHILRLWGIRRLHWLSRIFSLHLWISHTQQCTRLYLSLSSTFGYFSFMGFIATSRTSSNFPTICAYWNRSVGPSSSDCSIFKGTTNVTWLAGLQCFSQIHGCLSFLANELPQFNDLSHMA